MGAATLVAEEFLASGGSGVRKQRSEVIGG
jgi:hypothetical protein